MHFRDDGNFYIPSPLLYTAFLQQYFTFSYLDTLFHYLGKIDILAKRKGFQLRLLGYEMVV